MAAQATKQRQASSVVLSECMRTINRFLTANPNPAVGLLRQKMSQLIDAKEDLLEKHITYADKSNLDTASDDLRNWINPKLDEANDLSDKLFLLIDTSEQQDANTNAEAVENAKKTTLTQQRADEVEILTIQCERTVKIIEDKIVEMNEIVNDATRTSSDDKDLVRSHLKEIESFLEESSKSWNELKRLHIKDAVKLKAVFDQETKLKTDFSQNRLLASTFIGIVDPPIVVKDDTPSTNSNSKLLDMQKVKPPTFSGDIRSFAKFKADFKMTIEPKYPDSTHQAYILKQNCLQGEALDITKNLNSVTGIWERLHDKYGDETEIMNTVINEIEELPTSNSNQAFVKLVNVLEKFARS